MTNNVGDLVVVARRWAEEGRQHAGLVFSSDASLPRTRATIGRFVDLLEHLMTGNPGDASFIDRIHWLS